MELLLATIMIGGAAAIIAAPLRRSHRARAGARSARTAIEAARDAKYREILDAELDFRTGKLSESDYRAIDRALRGEAIELLRRLEAEDEPPEPAVGMR